MISQSRLWLEKQTQRICALQKDIRKYALPRLATDDLEGKWSGLDPDRRSEVLLEALYKTSCVGLESLDMENNRRWCPEMTLPNLSANNGRLFIDLLEKILTDDPTRQRSEPISFVHPTIDRISQYKSLEPIKPAIDSSRCYFISMTVWRILLALYDADESYMLAKLPRQSNIRVSEKEVLAHAKVPVCWCCDKTGVQLKVCSKCKEIGRSIRYCSKECQKEDWVKGIPRPHKSICGRPLMEILEETQQTSQKGRDSDCDDKIPEPDPLFKRTPALLHQIALLKKEENPDYVLVQPGLIDPDVGIQITNDQMRNIFLISRRRALKSGDRIAVNLMCRILLTSRVRSKAFTENLVNQLDKEYGVKVDLEKDMDHDDLEPRRKNGLKIFFSPSRICGLIQKR